ncbi:MazG nucleotide pyrophosphohydrolase domain-containing protein [Kribbella solani]|uniref:Putative HAD superfamily Cof-like phosphohydrolase n=1 Tax=Kribbella solani TaxID=236067 RepID=A0A841E328_9ACTN|nr:putative HAD superfamily Cof-like phosphohydrolase [Kribbella solani]
MAESPARLVREFHEAFELRHPDRPTPLPAGLAAARQRILDEEVREVAEAAQGGNLVEIAHELADVVYAAYGTAISYGIDLDAVLAEIHKANMTKLDANGRPIERDGKVQKSDLYRPPNIASVIAQQAGTA